MKVKIFTALLLLSVATTSVQAQDTQSKESQKEQKKKDASDKAAKADVLMQKNDIYDKQVLENQQAAVVAENKMKPVHSRPHFRKRKLHHRMRRRRG